MSSHSFTRNYTDHSSNEGFQFEFFCDKCGNGYRSSFQTSSLGFAASMLKAAGSILGGNAYRIGWGADQVKDAFRGPAWDSAFQTAIEESKPRFHQCTRCGKWVCPEVCWNQARGLCEECAPNLNEQAAAIQAQVAVEQAWTKARDADQMHGVDVQSATAIVGSSCPKCQATLSPGTKFCSGCGTAVGSIAAKGPKFCDQCGAELASGSHFCAQCGKQVG
ncbi:MAG TPA: zinc ribbon domain-containing protein [Polyangiaceae bacterium]|jgi:hypothetical protein